jgi:glycosyltransferase involved in cell wall biosynthesis
MSSSHAVPLVSIVTPAYNAARYLEDLLRSVRGQDYPHIEHIVIDDGSTDGGATRRILERYPWVRAWSRENRGQYATLNEGFRKASGDIVTTISADDTYVDAEAVSSLALFLAQHPKYDVAHGYTLHVDHTGAPLAVQPYQDYPYWMLAYNLGFISHCSLFVRRKRLLADGLLFDEGLRFAGDGDWLARLYLAGYRFGRVRRNVGAYRHHDVQATVQASADLAASAYRRYERALLDRKYAKSPALKWLVGAYVTFHRRRRIALGALRSGGTRGLVARVDEWQRQSRQPGDPPKS